MDVSDYLSYPTVKVENAKEHELLAEYIGTHPGEFLLLTRHNTINYPYWVYRNGWQPIEEDGTWYCQEAAEVYACAIPIKALLHPLSYPEYYI